MSDTATPASADTGSNTNPSAASTPVVNDESVRSVYFYESQARSACTLSKMIYDSASEEELGQFGTPEERNVLLGLFAYQLMGIAAVTGTTRATIFRALGLNKQGFGKGMLVSHRIATKQMNRRQEVKEAQTEGAADGAQQQQQQNGTTDTANGGKNKGTRKAGGKGKGKEAGTAGEGQTQA